MSNLDSQAVELRYSSSSPRLKVPPYMAHPEHGAFEVVHLHLFERQRGASRMPAHAHDVYHLVVFERADNRVVLNGQHVKTHRGLCVLTQPGDWHTFLPRLPGETVYHAFTFRFKNMSNPPSVMDAWSHYTGLDLHSGHQLFTLSEPAMLQLRGAYGDIGNALATSGSGRSARFC